MQFSPLYPWIYRGLKPLFPKCLWSGNGQEPIVALTFDDGPHPIHTPQLLEVLDEYGIPASFFWLGLCVERAPDIAARVYQRGDWLGLHGYTHQSFPFLSPTELKRELERTQTAIAAACSISPELLKDVRPPNGLFTPHTLELLHQWNYRPVMWSVVPEDWVSPGTDLVLQRIQQQVQNGSLIVLHDGYCGGASVAEIARRLIPWLLQQNYRFVTVDQLWQSHPLRGIALPDLI